MTHNKLRTNERNTTMPIIEARKLRSHDLDTVPGDKPGWYRWCATPEATRQLLGTYFDELRPHLLQGEEGSPRQGLYCVYVGIAVKESIRARLNWHVNQRHTVSCVKHGTLSTLRQSVSSLVGKDQGDERATNTLIDQLTVEYFPVDFPIRSEEAKQHIEEKEREKIKNHVIPLNIQNNHQPILADFKRALKKARKDARDRFLRDSQ